MDLRKFWLRRALRLLPAMVAMVVTVDLLALTLTAWHPNPYLEQSIAGTPAVLLYFSNWTIVWTQSPYLGWLGPMWSLSVEEQFYLVWPSVLFLCLRFRSSLALAAVAGVGVVFAMVDRMLVFDGTNLYRTFGTDFRLDMLFVGVLLAIALQRGHEGTIRKLSRWAVAPAVVALVALWFVVPDFTIPGTQGAARIYYTVGLPVVGLATASIIGFLVTNRGSAIERAFGWAPLRFTGQISYAMYLWHYPVAMLAFSFTSSRPLVFAVSLTAAYLLGAASWVWLERPMQARFHARLASPHSSTSLAQVPGVPLEATRG